LKLNTFTHLPLIDQSNFFIKNPASDNASKAMKILEKEFKIPQIISPNDLVNGRIDEKKQFNISRYARIN
jgi:hypothetical protein